MTRKTCASVACKSPATHVLRYSWPDDREHPVTELVCQPCGQGYVNRPSLKATLTTLPVTSSRRRNKLFVWEGVLTDYSSGMAVALAPDLETAYAVLASKVSEYGMSEIRSTTPTVINSLVGVPQEWHVHGGG